MSIVRRRYLHPAHPHTALALLIALLAGLALLPPAPAAQAAPALATARTALITPADGASGLKFGTAVAIDGDTMVVGATRGQTVQVGAAYVYVRGQDGAWAQVARLSTGASGDLFGLSVAISGDTIVVGGVFAFVQSTNKGAAYVFARNQGGPNAWGQVAELVASDGAGADEFGASVAVDADTIAVSALGSDGMAQNSGAVYLFTRGQAGDWDQTARLIAPDGTSGALFGDALAIDGDTLVAGASYAHNAYVFGRSAGDPNTWQLQAKLAPDPGGQGRGSDFGYSVGLSGDTVVVGSPDEAAYGTSSGAAYVFARSADANANPADGNLNEWGRVAKLRNADSAPGDRAGYAVAIEGDTIAVGANGFYPTTPKPTFYDTKGSVHIFQASAGTWAEVAALDELPLFPGDPEVNLGLTAGLSNGTLVTTANVYFSTVPQPVYVYQLGATGSEAARNAPPSGPSAASPPASRPGPLTSVTPPTLTSRLGAISSPGDANSLPFGNVLAIDGDTMVVGTGELSRAMIDTGRFQASGLAYVYLRGPDGGWSAVARLASGDAGDHFGRSVAIRGDTIVVGAPHGNGLVAGAGAAYVFARNQGGPNAWGQVARLTATDGGRGHGFGWSVAVSGGTIAVGAIGAAGAVDHTGAIYTFAQDAGDAWAQTAKLLAADQVGGGYLGVSLALDGDTVLAGALFYTPVNRFNKGAAYIFGRGPAAPAAWAQLAKLGPDAGKTSSFFGMTVAVDGDTAVVGSLFENGAASSSGAAYVFGRNADANGKPADGNVNEWGKTTKLTRAGAQANDQFGYPVAIDGDTIAVSANGSSLNNSVHLFRASAGAWSPAAVFDEQPATAGGPRVKIGSSLGISGGTIATGATMFASPSSYLVYLYQAKFPISLAFSSPSPAGGQYAAAYSHQFIAAGSRAASFSLTGGQLPPGLSLSADGVLSGTPTQAGSFGPLTVTASNADDLPASQVFSLTVAPTPLSVIAAGQTRTYGAANPALTYAVAGLQNGDQAADVLSGALTTAATPSSPAGGYPIARGSLAASANYQLAFTPASLTVDPAPLRVAAAGQTRTYGAANPALTFTVAGLQYGDQAADVLSGALTTPATPSSPAGSYPIARGSLAASTNYQLAFTPASLTVDPAPLSVIAAGQTRTYGAANPALTFTVAGLQNGDQAADVLSGALTTAATPRSPAGSYPIAQGSLAASANYQLAFTPASLTVDPAPLRVAAAGQTRTYGAANPALTYTVAGLQNGDQAADVLSGALTTAATPSSPAGSYPIAQGSLAASANYQLAFTPASLTIAPAPLSVAAAGQTRTYGAANPALTYTVAGLQNGDQAADVLSGALTTPATPSSPAGSYPIAQGSLAASANYQLSFTPADLTVDPAPLRVAADGQTRTYGAANPALTYTVAGLQNGDQAAAVLSGALSTAATPSSPIGSYPIAQGSLAANANYQLAFTPASLTIAPAPLSVAADGQTRTYGAANPALTYTVAGLQNGDQAADVLSGDLTTAATPRSPAGSYPIAQGSLAANANYQLAFTPATLVVRAAEPNPGRTRRIFLPLVTLR